MSEDDIAWESNCVGEFIRFFFCEVDKIVSVKSSLIQISSANHWNTRFDKIICFNVRTKRSHCDPICEFLYCYRFPFTCHTQVSPD